MSVYLNGVRVSEASEQLCALRISRRISREVRPYLRHGRRSRRVNVSVEVGGVSGRGLGGRDGRYFASFRGRGRHSVGRSGAESGLGTQTRCLDRLGSDAPTPSPPQGRGGGKKVRLARLALAARGGVGVKRSVSLDSLSRRRGGVGGNRSVSLDSLSRRRGGVGGNRALSLDSIER